MQRVRYSRYLKLIILLLDLLVIAWVSIFFFLSKNKELIHDHEVWYENSFAMLLLMLFWGLLSGKTKLYNIRRNLTYTIFVERIITHFILFVIGLLLIRKVSNNRFFSSELLWFSLYLFSIILFTKSLIYFGIKYLRSLGINNRNVMFLNENSSTNVLKSILKERKDFGLKIFEYPLQSTKKEDLESFWKNNGIHTLFLPLENHHDKKKEDEILMWAEANKVRISIIPNISQCDLFTYDLAYVETQPVLNQSKYPLDYYSNFLFKRIFDIIFSLIVIITICSWLFPIIAIFIKLTSKGPIFFTQKRYGYHENIFNCLKFRTMVVNNNSTTQTTSVNDLRITKAGNFLRKTSLDEMPQFINVLRGQMSVVGPRPHMLVVDNYFKPKIERYSLRSRVSPGITGLSQVSGLRGDSGNIDTEMKKRILADAFYVRNWSFVLDLVIILKTVVLIIKGDQKAK